MSKTLPARAAAGPAEHLPGHRALSGRTAIVTGGASGIGESIARTFAANGASIAIVDIDGERGQAVASELAEADQAGFSLVADVADPEAVAAAVPAAIERLGGLDILVNCAGLNIFGDPQEITPERWRQILSVNLDGTWYMCSAAIPALAESGRGRIINLASAAGVLGIPKAVHYTAAKHGIVGLTRALALDLGRFGTTVNVLCPGPTLTPLMNQATSETFKEEALKRLPIQRLGRPSDIASAALFLASDAAEWITGVALPVDGGLTAGIRSRHWE